MKCCVPQCQSYSDRRSDDMNGITFHLFPSDENLKQQWITKLNRPDWTPTKHTKICSCHFNDSDFKLTKKGLKKLKKDIVPSVKLDLLLERKLPEPVKSSVVPTKCDLNEFLVLNDSLRENKLKNEIIHLRYKEKQSKIKIRSLQMQLRRLNKKVNESETPEETRQSDEAPEPDSDEECPPGPSEPGPSAPKRRKLHDEEASRVAETLQDIQSQLHELTSCDTYDNFGKYIACLLRTLPPGKALTLQPQIVTLITGVSSENLVLATDPLEDVEIKIEITE